MRKGGQGFVRHVQGKTVHADPTANANTDARQLPIADPDSSEPVTSPGVDAETAADVKQEIFNRTQIDVQVLSALAQVEDRVANKLTGTMVGGLATSVGDVDRVRKRKCFSETGLIGSATDCVNRFVFQEEEMIGLGRVSHFS
jgi:hypothetical protein